MYLYGRADALLWPRNWTQLALNRAFFSERHGALSVPKLEHQKFSAPANPEVQSS